MEPEIPNDDFETESDEEEQEPKFKYKRILNDITKIFQGDAASCIAIHDKFLALGTQWGRIYILDHMGNMLPNKVVVAHQVSVNAISIDKSGDYLASCSNDGKIFIYGLSATDYNQVVNMERPIRAVGLSPSFSRQGSGQEFVSGDRSLVLHERGFFSRDKQQIVYAGEERDGFVSTVVWQGPFIAFANDTGVRVYDKDLRKLITQVKPRHDTTLYRSQLHPPSITWLNAKEFAIEDEGRAPVAAGADAGETMAAMLEGSAAAEAEEEAEAANLTSPRVWIIEPLKFEEFELITEDIVETRDSESLLPHHYRLGGLPLDSIFFLLSSRDMIEVKPCSSDDHVDWLLENGLFRKALDFTKKNPEGLERYSTASVGRIYLDHLLEERDFAGAAAICAKVCGSRKDVWEEYVTRFDADSALAFLAPTLPTRNPQLEPECYEMVLIAFLDSDVGGFRRLISEWSPDLYRIGGLITQTLEKLYRKNLDDGVHNSLLATLAQLYTYERNYERALAIYMNLGDRSVFQLIDRFRLFPQVKERIRELMDIDTNLAVRLLLENEDSLPASLVMKQLTRHPKLQLAYLNRLFSRNEGAEFADLAVSLYADFEPSRLLSFLRNSEHYLMDKALEICRSKHLTKEIVFLLGRSGNRREALRVIISEQKDIMQAIEFCKEHDDEDLWADLISFGVKRPEFIKILMRNIGTYIDPTMLIQRIPPKMEIPGLPESLVKILGDYSLQMSLQEGCRRVTLADAFAALQRLVTAQRRGARVADDRACEQCAKALLEPQRSASAQGIVDFGCGHGYHEQCLFLLDSLSLCPLCRASALTPFLH